MLSVGDMGRGKCSSTLVSSLKVSSGVLHIFVFSPGSSEIGDLCLLFLCVVYYFGCWLCFLPVSNPGEAVGLQLFIPNSCPNLITGTRFGS